MKEAASIEAAFSKSGITYYAKRKITILKNAICAGSVDATIHLSWLHPMSPDLFRASVGDYFGAATARFCSKTNLPRKQF
jgi:hypothetical protein